jgi:molybdopterin synthase catalytic subunit
MTVRVQAENFDLAGELAGFGAGSGAIVTFTGLVRDLPGGGLLEMTIEHYPAMTGTALAQIETDARARWNLSDCLIIHRFGPLHPGDQIMMVATASKHRKDAFQSAEFLMDYLKSRAPFWKKETTDQGATWVDSKAKDEIALDRWS